MKTNTIDKKIPSTLNSALIEMSEHVEKYSDATSTEEREHHRETVLVKGYEAAMQMALKQVRVGRQGSRAHQEAEDAAIGVAQALAGSSSWIDSCNDALDESRENGERSSGEHSRMKGVLHTVIYHKTIDALRPWMRLEKRTTTDERVHSGEYQIPGALPDTPYHKNLEHILGVRSSCQRVKQLEEEFLNGRKYLGAPVKQALGGWRPSMEWMKSTEVCDRPDGIPNETITRMIRQTKKFILKNYRRKEKMPEREGPSL